MQGILDSARQATQIMGEIAIAGKEQSLGIAHINEAVDQIESITQDNTQAVSETARTAEALQAQAATLYGLINAFKLIETEPGSSETTTTVTLAPMKNQTSTKWRRRKPTVARLKMG
jgi:methyl-accepting chemotaxis protein